MKSHIIKYSVLAMALLIFASTFAQQDPSYSMFMYNGSSINPAIAGSAGAFSGTAVYRDQWVKIKGAPRTQFLNVDMPVYNDKVGIGLIISNDELGVTQNQHAAAQYAYRLKFEKGTLAMGLQAGVNHFRANYASVATNPLDVMDNSFATNVNSVFLNVGTGLFYYSEKFSIGFSIPRLINHTVDKSQPDQNEQYYVTASYTIQLSPDWILKPSTMMTLGHGVPFHIDINSNIWYKERVSVGASYKSNDSVTGIVQLRVAEDFTAGYAYNYAVSSASKSLTGSSELMIRFTLASKNNNYNQRRY